MMQMYQLYDPTTNKISEPMSEGDLWKIVETTDILRDNIGLVSSRTPNNYIPIRMTRFASNNPLRKSKIYRFIATHLFNIFIGLNELDVASGHTTPRDPEDYEEIREIAKEEGKGCLFCIVLIGIVIIIAVITINLN